MVEQGRVRRERSAREEGGGSDRDSRPGAAASPGARRTADTGKRPARGLWEVRDCRAWAWSPEVTGDFGRPDAGCRCQNQRAAAPGEIGRGGSESRVR